VTEPSNAGPDAIPTRSAGSGRCHPRGHARRRGRGRGRRRRAAARSRPRTSVRRPSSPDVPCMA